jgi:Transglycosylase SLT domain
VAAPFVIAAGATARDRLAHLRFAPAAVAALAGLLAVLALMLVGVVAAMFGLQPPAAATHGPSALARSEIPPAYLRLYMEAGARYGIDPWVLAAIGWVETAHGGSAAPGVRSGVNAYGCCAGPMQFNVRNGPPSTWDAYGVDGDGDGRRSPYDPADAIPAAARYLQAAGAPQDYRAALFAYNHADWYVAQVLAKAAEYRGVPRPGAGLMFDPATVRELLGGPRVALAAMQRADLLAGIDPRLVTALAAIGRRHTVMITALQSDHSPGTNHEAGRAMDIGAVDGEICRGGRGGACAQLVRELAAVEGRLRSTELIYCWDPDGPADSRGFARADHCDHIHVGWDA